MRIINNRYIIDKMIRKDQVEETYTIKDSWSKDAIYHMRMLDSNKDKETIEYYLEEFIQIAQIKHKNLLSSNDFGIVETINLKKTDNTKYYVVSEYTDWTLLKIQDVTKDLKHRLHLLLDIISLIDYLHFRGITYRVLCPSHIFYSKEKGIKLMNLSVSLTKPITSFNDGFDENFLAPEVLMNNSDFELNSDKYSIGMIIKYLLHDCPLSDSGDHYTYIEDLNLSSTQKEFFDDIINDLTKSMPANRKLSLREIINDIIRVFNLNYSYDLVRERDTLFFNTPIVGLNREINEILATDWKIGKDINYYKGIVIRGGSGLGKTKLLQEASFRLRMRCRTVYNINCSKVFNKQNITKFFNKITEKTPDNVIAKYKDDLSSLIALMTDDYDNYQLNDRLRFFNRISNFFNEISKDNKFYIIIEDFEKTNSIFIQFFDFLIRNIDKNQIFFLLSYNEISRKSDEVSETIYNLAKNLYITFIDLKPLSLDDTGRYIKDVLGIPFIPYNFVTSIYNESKGIPGYISLIIKDLYDREQLYVGENGLWEIRNTDRLKLNIPSNINDALLNQLKRYEDSYLEVIKYLSIFNIKTIKEVILDMVDFDEKKLDAILKDLVKERFLEESIGDLGYYYSLTSEELKRYLYLNMPEDMKLEFHAKAADILMKFYKGNFRLILDELVYHLQKAKKYNKATDIITNEAEKLGYRDISNTIKLWEMAYNINDYIPNNSRLRILDNLTNFYQIKGNIEETDFYLEKLLKETECGKNLEYYIKAKEYQSEALFNNNRIDELYKEVEELEHTSNTYDYQEGKIFAHVIRAKLLIRDLEIDTAIENINKALYLCDKYGIDRNLAQLYNLYGLANYFIGNKELALDFFKKSISYCQKGNKAYVMVIPINNIANVYADSYGDLEKSLEYQSECLEISMKYGFQHFTKRILNNIGENYIELLDYDKALEHIEESRIIADKTNDINLAFLSSINLGYVYFAINQFSKAYRVFTFLEKINFTNSISDTEIKHQYYNFLGEFYYRFGKLDLAQKYSKIARDFFKEYNIKDYLKAETRLIYVKYQLNVDVDKEDINCIIDQFNKTKMIHGRSSFILTMSKLALINGDKDLLNMMMGLYDDFDYDNKSDLLDYNYKIIKLLLNTSEETLNKADEILNRNIYSELLKAEIDYRIYLGLQYINMGSYSKALRQFLEAIEGLHKIVRNLPDNDLKDSLLLSKNPDFINEQIIFILEKGFKKDVSKVLNKNTSIKEFNRYFDIAKVIDSLSKREYYDILYYHDSNANIMSITDLLSSISDNSKENLKLILNYAARETIAKRGMIIKIDEETESFKPLVSLNSDDKIPDEIILLNSLKGKESFLYNKNIKDYNKLKFGNMFSNDITAAVCLPIRVSDNLSYEKVERRKTGLDKDYKLVGYLYLETDRIINRFDMDSYTIISSLTSLIYLNIENDKLKRISTTDKVTGTYTRKYFEEKLDKILEFYKENDSSFSLLMIDIDRFKIINDTYGHLKGDEVLFTIGKTLLNSVRESDFVGRYGGEEYLVLLNHTNIEEGLKIASKIRQNIEGIKFPGIERTITISIGMSQYPIHSEDKNDLIYKADQALYYAKEVLGRNRISLWNSCMDNASNKADKLTGLITGDSIRDNQNILAIAEISYMNVEDRPFEEKTFDFLGRLNEIVGGETASLITYDDNKPVKKITRIRKDTAWANNDFINYKLINKVIQTRVGESFIDWENVEIDENNMEDPNWQAVLIVPIIKDRHLKAVVYITAPLKEKEFDSMDLNISILLSNIFVGSIK